MWLYSPFREFSVALKAGWNMLSLPLEPVDKRKSILYPAAGSPAYTYSNSSGYLRKDTLESCVGYWMKFSAPGSVSILGENRDRDTIAVEAGWNMIGSVSFSRFFGYSGTYVQIDTVWPGRAYWVKTNKPRTSNPQSHNIRLT